MTEFTLMKLVSHTRRVAPPFIACAHAVVTADTVARNLFLASALLAAWDLIGGYVRQRRVELPLSKPLSDKPNTDSVAE